MEQHDEPNRRNSMEGTPRGTDIPLVHRTADSNRRELLDLARGVAAGTVRPSLADALVPLTASEFARDPLAVFHRVLVPAVRDHDADLIASSLNLLMGQEAA
jgi:hypothetical protein